MTTLIYPKTRTESIVDERAGVEFPDPYRWLEGNTEEVQLWQKAQSELAIRYVRDWPHFDALFKSVARFSAPRFEAVPRFAGGKWFWMQSQKASDVSLPVVGDAPFSDHRVLFDPALMAEGADDPLVTWISPAPDGHTLALGVCTDGSEANTIRLIDVTTGALLPDPPSQVLMDNWTNGAQWLPDSSGFFFLTVDLSTMDRQIMLHRRGDPSTTIPTTLPVSKIYTQVTVSRDGHRAIAHQRMMNPCPIAVLDLTDPAGDWQPFVTEIEGTLAGYVIGDRYIAVTDVGAPRGRVVAIPLDTDDPNHTEAWIELVPESEAVIRSLTPVGDRMYVYELIDTFARIRIFGIDGSPQGEAPLPGHGALNELPFPLMNLAPKGHPDEFVFAYSSLTESWGIYRHRPGDTHIDTLKEPTVRLEGARGDSYRATSKDGTEIPYHVLRLEGADRARPQPALIYAYGGFNAPWLPVFPNAMAAFVTAGGIFVHAHLRGGGEFGLEWWQGGRMKNKQNCYDDLYAIADDLITRGESTPALLGVVGGSNGGLMAGVAITQRPDLWRVVIPRVPLLDIIGACREPYGQNAVAIEFGDPGNADDIRRIARYSPYHLIETSTAYPAMFVDAGDTDPRCPPWHARKFVAKIQAATSSNQPLLLRVLENVGHGWATPKKIQITQNTEWLAFAMIQLGMTPEGR